MASTSLDFRSGRDAAKPAAAFRTCRRRMARSSAGDRPPPLRRCSCTCGEPSGLNRNHLSFASSLRNEIGFWHPLQRGCSVTGSVLEILEDVVVLARPFPGELTTWTSDQVQDDASI